MDHGLIPTICNWMTLFIIDLHYVNWSLKMSRDYQRLPKIIKNDQSLEEIIKDYQMTFWDY